MTSNSSRSSTEIELITSEINQLLDISPDPSILVSNSDSSILASNAPMAELSGYTRRELLSLQLDTLLPEFSSLKGNETANLELQTSQGYKVDLISRRKQKISTNIQAKTLGNNRRFSVYRFTPMNKPLSKGTSSKQSSSQMDAILQLSKVFYQPDLESALDIIIHMVVVGNFIRCQLVVEPVGRRCIGFRAYFPRGW